MISAKKLEEFKGKLEGRIAEVDRSLASTERDARALANKPADPLDQAALEYEKQAVLHKASTDRQLRQSLVQALKLIHHGTFGECDSCRGEIEPKRLEALPFARYCIRCQEEMERK